MSKSGSMKKVAMPADAKLVNRQMVMNVLRRGEIVTVADIREYLSELPEYAELLPKMDAYMEQYCVF